MRTPSSLILIAVLGFGSTGCVSMVGRMTATAAKNIEASEKEPDRYFRDYVVYPGVQYLPYAVRGSERYPWYARTWSLFVSCVDFPVSLALDTLLLPVDLTLWLVTSDKPRGRAEQAARLP